MDEIIGTNEQKVIEEAKKKKKDFYVIKEGKKYHAKHLFMFLDKEIIGSRAFLKKQRGWKELDPAFVSAVVLEYRDILRHSFIADSKRVKRPKSGYEYSKKMRLDERTKALFKAIEKERE